jgi:putative Holliday junction resolvase
VAFAACVQNQGSAIFHVDAGLGRPRTHFRIRSADFRRSGERIWLAYNDSGMASTVRTSSTQPARPSALLGRILALDYGRRRIGVAVSDELGITAQPVGTLERKNRREDLRRLRALVRHHGSRHILVGHPLHLDGSSSEMSKEAARFAGRIAKELGVSVELVDERLTSWEAAQALPENKSSARRRRGPLDDVAAAVLLREYLDRKRASAKAGDREKR